MLSLNKPHNLRQIYNRNRKDARTRIYRAFYGIGGKTCNDPSQPGTRVRPQDWSLQDMLHTVKENWRAAAFHPKQAKALLEDINGTLEVRGQSLLKIEELQS